jgi:CDGSH-type Zn-finger protein
MKYFIEQVKPNLWKVTSEEEGETYVTFNGKYLICECTYYQRKHFCRHERAVVYFLITGTNVMEVENDK